MKRIADPEFVWQEMALTLQPRIHLGQVILAFVT